MKTQTSRDTYRPDARVSGVYLQQGRMIVDADWNEAVDVGKARLEDALRDAVGSGAPREGGLAITKPANAVLIRPGVLYAEGVPARLYGPSAGLSPSAQPDYKHAPALPQADIRFYADVWERAFTGLEDTALLDAGLHGADTATRTRTMLQIKWCPAAIDPLDPALNPPVGTAGMRLQLRQIINERDCCDPCAAEVAVDERIGNYQFRCEVHDVREDGSVVLKWSRDNGAEAYTPDAFPEGFDQGDWSWEFFDRDSENLLGKHFLAGTDPPLRRGVLVDSFTAPAAPQPRAFVRQWDGYVVFHPNGGGSLLGGRDRNVALSTSLGADAHGYVHFDINGIQLNLDLVEMHLSLDGARFVAGDYWQASIREAIHVSGDWVMGEVAGEPPRGVRHHYLPLAELDATGALVPWTDAQRRQMTFPPLTDLRAADVGFTSHCDGLFAGAQNVQAALDALCGIGAEDIAYSLPECGMGSGQAPTLRSLMASVPNFPDLDGVDPKPSVKDLLDALLCHLDATRVPLDKQQLTCGDLKDDAQVVTVQDALDALCKRPGGGCEISVPPGELERVLFDFMHSDVQDLSLCLLPGSHPLSQDVTIARKRSLRIHAASPHASIIELGDHTLHVIELQDFGMARLQLRATAAGQVRLECQNVSVDDCIFRRTATAWSNKPFFRTGRIRSERSLSWRGNTMQDVWVRRSPWGGGLLNPDLIRNPGLSTALTRILDDSRTVPQAELETSMSAVLDAFEAMQPAERMRLAGVLDPPDPVAPSRAAVTKATQRVARKTTKRASKTTSVRINALAMAAPLAPELNRALVSRVRNHALPMLVATTTLREELERGTLNRNLLGAMLLDRLYLYGFDSGFNTALAVDDYGGEVVIAGNQIQGDVFFMGGLQFDDQSPNLGSDPHPWVNAWNLDSSVLGDGFLQLRDNQVGRVVSPLPARSVHDGIVLGRIPGWSTAVVSGNAFNGIGHSLIAVCTTLTGNHFQLSSLDQAIGRMFAWHIALSGNSANNTNDKAKMYTTVQQDDPNYFGQAATLFLVETFGETP